MPGVFRRSRRTFYYLLALTLLRLLRGLSIGTGRRLCRRIAVFALSVRGRERHLADRNLTIAFPELDARGREARIRASIECLGENFFDALTFEEAQSPDFMDIDGDDAIAAAEALGDGNRGLLILTGHMGCWELLGAYLAHRLKGLTVVTGRIRNPAVDRLINDRRRRSGLRIVHRDGDLRPLIRDLREGRTVAVLMDQNTRTESRDIPFFGCDAPTAVGFARLALRYRTPILPVAIARSGRGHRIKHQPPLDPADYIGEDREYRLLRDCNLRLETFIREDPREWVWFHDRWRIGKGSLK